MSKKTLLIGKISQKQQSQKPSQKGKSGQEFAKALKKAVREGVFPPPEVNALNP